MSNGIIATVIVIMLVWAGNSLVGHDTAMEKCLETHSRDTCVSNLR